MIKVDVNAVALGTGAIVAVYVWFKGLRVSDGEFVVCFAILASALCALTCPTSLLPLLSLDSLHSLDSLSSLDSLHSLDSLSSLDSLDSLSSILSMGFMHSMCSVHFLHSLFHGDGDGNEKWKRRFLEREGECNDLIDAVSEILFGECFRGPPRP
jgi:hypothetical protein